MKNLPIRHLFSLGACLAFLSGCSTNPLLHPFSKWSGPTAPLTQPPEIKLPLEHKPPYWAGDGVGEPTGILVRLSEQHAYFFRGKKLVGVTVISSGKKGFQTPAGNYHVIQKDKDHVSNLYGDYVDASGTVVKSGVDATKSTPPEDATFRGAKMPYFLRFSGGAGLHAGRVPNFPASHGCVRLPADMAKHFFENSQLGTPVWVQD